MNKEDLTFNNTTKQNCVQTELLVLYSNVWNHLTVCK